MFTDREFELGPFSFKAVSGPLGHPADQNKQQWKKHNAESSFSVYSQTENTQKHYTTLQHCNQGHNSEFIALTVTVALSRHSHEDVVGSLQEFAAG